MRMGDWACPECPQRVVMTFTDHACTLCGWRPNVADDADLRIDLKAAQARADRAEAELARLRGALELIDRCAPRKCATDCYHAGCIAMRALRGEEVQR